jgi:ATP-dependent RNA helicase DeaD
MKDFNELGLSKSLLDCLKKMKFSEPTPIQAKTIPVALEGSDVMGSARTGTGKTAAFGIPLVEHLIANPDSAALIMAPTRELAAQVLQSLQNLLDRELFNKTVLLIGGDPMPRQLRKLRAHPRLIVGTPGRINDHLMRKSLKLHNVDFLVLDEADRMLDMGFSVQIDQIIKHLPKKRQTLLFSATMPKSIVNIANQYLTDPVRVAVDDKIVPAANVKQEIVHVTQREKYDKLIDQLEQREGSVIIFVKTKISADRLTSNLRDDGHLADTIHGDLRHTKRERVIKSFRNRKFRVMVATDIAARGLDIPHIEHVINYDLPQCPEDYVHRIGRTARAGRSGESLCFVTAADGDKWYAINRLINPDSPEAKRPPSKNFSKKGRGGKGYGASRGGNGNGGRGGNSRSGGYRGDSRRSESRGDSRSDNYRGDSRRSESRGDNRSESRGDSRRSESRGDNRSESRSDNYRGDSRRSESRGDNRSDNYRGDSRRSESRGDSRRSESRGDSRRSESRGDSRRSESRGDSRNSFNSDKPKSFNKSRFSETSRPKAGV